MAEDFSSPDGGLPPLRVGTDVVSTNETPVFSSDPQPGDLGTLQEADESSTSYLVRWQDGRETWVRRDQIERPGRRRRRPPQSTSPAAPPQGAPEPRMAPPADTSGPAPATTQAASDAPQPTRTAGPRRGGRRGGAPGVFRFLPFLILLGAVQGLARNAFHQAKHPTGSGIALVVIVAVLIVLAFLRFRRRFS
jgi:hypothetical protein